MATATQIAQKFVAESPQLIVPITTPSAQITYNATRGTKIPVVFAAVSDPVSAKLVAETTLTGKGITGVSDLSPIQKQLDLIKALQPSIQKIGFLYNPGEANSVALLHKFRKFAESMGFIVIEAPSPNTSEVATAVRPLLRTVEAIYIPNDNTIISALESVLRIVDHKLPIYAADPDSVERGCLAAAAMSQYGLGRETGKLAVRVLRGENPDTIAIVTPHEIETTINRDVAKKLGIEIPKELLQIARVVPKMYTEPN
jgi:putative ABC transport system substrate-binding protein